MRKKNYVQLFFLECCACCIVQSAFPQAGEWTFMKGDSLGASPGNYGIQGVPGVTNNPPAFYEASEWTDHQGNFWMYGGFNWGIGGSSTSAMWKYDPLTNIWTWLQGSDLYSQPPVFGTKGVSSPANSPGAVAFGASTFTDSTDNLWLVFGGSAAGEYNTLWKYDIGTNEWTWMSGDSINNSTGQFGIQGIPSVSNSPPARSEAVTSWVDEQGNFWTFGGLSLSLVGILNDLWRYNPSTNEWTWMRGLSTTNAPSIYGTKGVANATNLPGARVSYTRWKDLQGHLWLFGGALGIGGPALSDLWKFDISSNEFTWMSGSNLTGSQGLNGGFCNADTTYYPVSRYENKACWTDSCGNFWMMGGVSLTGQFLADLWKYTPATNEWMLVYGNSVVQDTGMYGVIGVSSPLNRPPGRNGTSSWRDLSGNLWLYGGYVYRTPYPCMSDLWRYVPDPACGGCATLLPIAQFAADNHICPGTCVDFTNLSVYASSYQWNFSGATPDTSTGVNPASICYSVPGNYDVTLIASGANGVDTLTLLNYITVFPYPSPQGIFQSGDTLFANPGAVTYQWYHDGNIIPGATTYYYLATESGDFNVVATDINGCEVEAAIFDVAATVPSLFFGEDAGVRLFPNPANDFLSVEAGFNIKSMAIFNSLGEKMSDEKMLLSDNPMKTELDIHSLAAGIYWLEVSSGENIFRIKFLKPSYR